MGAAAFLAAQLKRYYDKREERGMRLLSAAAGHHGGRNESTGRVGKYIKAKKRVKHNRMSLKRIQEVPGIVQDYNCAYVGHSTLPCEFALKTACFGLARLMLSRLGNPPSAVDSSGTTLDGVLTLIYREVPTASASTVTVVNYSNASVTVNSMGTSLFSTIKTAASTQPMILLDALLFEPEINSTSNVMTSVAKSINLNHAIIEISCVSNLKVQNATKHETADGIDSELTTVVDAVPLIGKIYSGSGQGAWPSTGDGFGLPLISDPLYGNIYQQAGSVLAFQEPVNPEAMQNIKKVSGVKFEPGEIHTSKLVDGFKGTFQKYCRILLPVMTETFYATYSHGKFAVMGLEKIIGLKTATAGAYTPVRLIYEINQEWDVYVSEQKQIPLLQTYDKAVNFTLGP